MITDECYTATLNNEWRISSILIGIVHNVHKASSHMSGGHFETCREWLSQLWIIIKKAVEGRFISHRVSFVYCFMNLILTLFVVFGFLLV